MFALTITSTAEKAMIGDAKTASGLVTKDFF